MTWSRPTSLRTKRGLQTRSKVCRAVPVERFVLRDFRQAVGPTLLLYSITMTRGRQRGSIEFDGGIPFRVWAPHATDVAAMGMFGTGDGETVVPLAREDGGLWSADVPGCIGGGASNLPGSSQS